MNISDIIKISSSAINIADGLYVSPELLNFIKKSSALGFNVGSRQNASRLSMYLSDQSIFSLISEDLSDDEYATVVNYLTIGDGAKVKYEPNVSSELLSYLNDVSKSGTPVISKDQALDALVKLRNLSSDDLYKDKLYNELLRIPSDTYINSVYPKIATVVKMSSVAIDAQQDNGDIKLLMSSLGDIGFKIEDKDSVISVLNMLYNDGGKFVDVANSAIKNIIHFSESEYDSFIGDIFAIKPSDLPSEYVSPKLNVPSKDVNVDDDIADVSDEDVNTEQSKEKSAPTAVPPTTPSAPPPTITPAKYKILMKEMANKYEDFTNILPQQVKKVPYGESLVIWLADISGKPNKDIIRGGTFLHNQETNENGMAIGTSKNMVYVIKFPSNELDMWDTSVSDDAGRMNIRKSTNQIKREASIKMADLDEEASINNLEELTTPGRSTHFDNTYGQSYHDENKCEDTDVKLGDVECPYSNSPGAMPIDTDEDKKFNIVRGASISMRSVITHT